MPYKKEAGLTRRGFLLALLFISDGIKFLRIKSPTRLLNFLMRRIANYKKPSLDKSYPTGMLSKKEMGIILALSEVLAPQDGTLGSGDDFFRNHINYKTSNMRGYLKEYREGVKLLEEATRSVIGANKGFFEINNWEREKVLESILWRYRSDEVIRPFLERIFVSERNLAFREFIVKDVLMAFYASQAGWAVVGYSHYPGVPAADPREYTRPLTNSITH